MEVRERPILFSAAMVRAILDGRKTQTRRVVKPQPTHRLVEPKLGLTIGMDPADDGAVWYDADGISPGRPVRCPYGRPLDRLWVRESFIRHASIPQLVGYVADGCEATEHWEKQSPSIHMPRRFCRIVLEIADVRVERVQEITEEDAKAEGAPWEDCWPTYRQSFEALWDSINGPRGYGWDANPWVWVVGFRKVGA